VSKERKVVVGIGTPEIAGGPPTIILGMTPQAWDAMAGEGTHTFDLRKVGVNVQILMFRGESHAAIAETLASGAAMMGAPFTDARKNGELPDLGIDDPTVQ
jgi:hypothetical protein